MNSSSQTNLLLVQIEKDGQTSRQVAQGTELQVNDALLSILAGRPFGSRITHVEWKVVDSSEAPAIAEAFQNGWKDKSQDFATWMREVSRECSMISGLSAEDLPDWDFAASFECGDTPQIAARALLVDSDFPFDQEEAEPPATFGDSEDNCTGSYV